jgi:periplasmic protein TonB
MIMGTSTLASPPKPGTRPTKEAPDRTRIEYELPLHETGGEAVAVHEVPFRLFSEALLDMSTTRPGRRTFDFIASIFIHALFLGILLMIPFYFTEGIDLTQFTRTLLVAPPPPPPPPPAAPAVVKQVVPVQRVFMHAGKLMAPSAIPQKIAMIKEQELPPDLGGEGVVGGVPGGVPGGQMGGVIGGIITGADKTFIPAVPHPMPTLKAPLRVGGRVKPPRPISTPQPVYPQLARMGRIEGEVILDTVIDADGSVVQLRVISGPPLLIPAAVEAVTKWKYEPTYLNEQPVPVSMTVIVRFNLQ